MLTHASERVLLLRIGHGVVGIIDLSSPGVRMPTTMKSPKQFERFTR